MRSWIALVVGLAVVALAGYAVLSSNAGSRAGRPTVSSADSRGRTVEHGSPSHHPSSHGTEPSDHIGAESREALRRILVEADAEEGGP